MNTNLHLFPNLPSLSPLTFMHPLTPNTPSAHVGLLTLLEVAPNVFIVNRVPKEDTVSLANSENLEIDPATVAANLDNINLRRRMLLVGIPPPAAPKSVARSNVDNQTGIDLSETPSACLYLNSVPAIYTESILAAEMAPYNVSTVRLVSHRNRRFGFIGFATTEEAGACAAMQHCQ